MKNQNSPFFAQRYRMVSLETWWHFLLRKYFWISKKINKPLPHYVSQSTNTPNKRESYLLVNFALFNSRHEKILFWAYKFAVEEFTCNLSQIILLWINFQDHGELLKTTKIRLLRILNLEKGSLPGKTSITWNSEFLKEERPFLNQV